MALHRGAARIHDDELGAALGGLLEEGRCDRMVLGRIGADDDDDFRVLALVEGGGHGGRADIAPLRGIPRLIFTAALFLVIGFGAVVIWQTRAENALALGDPSSSLRVQVALVGFSRIRQHPVFGHGMDAIHLHWNEWGFPGKDMLHMHSTPLQIAFDRGLPMLALWLWLMIAFWINVSRSAKVASDRSDTTSYGILLGVLGALTGFLASSLVNYNYGDSEVAMMFWWLMGIAMAVQSELASET